MTLQAQEAFQPRMKLDLGDPWPHPPRNLIECAFQHGRCLSDFTDLKCRLDHAHPADGVGSIHEIHFGQQRPEPEIVACRQDIELESDPAKAPQTFTLQQIGRLLQTVNGDEPFPWRFHARAAETLLDQIQGFAGSRQAK